VVTERSVGDCLVWLREIDLSQEGRQVGCEEETAGSIGREGGGERQAGRDGYIGRRRAGEGDVFVGFLRVGCGASGWHPRGTLGSSLATRRTDDIREEASFLPGCWLRFLEA
jgi:hypothetical protein